MKNNVYSFNKDTIVELNTKELNDVNSGISTPFCIFTAVTFVAGVAADYYYENYYEGP